MKTTPIFIAICLLCFSAFGQSTFDPDPVTFEPSPLDELSRLPLDQVELVPVCSRTIAKSPTVRGLKLNMTRTTAQKVFPARSRIKLQSGNNFLWGRDLAKLKSYRGVTDAYIFFSPSSGKATLISFSYSYTQWNSLDEFARSVTKSLNLPHDPLSINGDTAVLDCDGWVMAIKMNAISLISDSFYSDRIKQNENKKKAFKP